jgi:hypothetical protein
MKSNVIITDTHIELTVVGKKAADLEKLLLTLRRAGVRCGGGNTIENGETIKYDIFISQADLAVVSKL